MEPIKVNKKCTAFSKYCAFFVKKYIFAQLLCNINSKFRVKFNLVPKAGLEPARVLTPAGFSYYYSFHYHLYVCSLDFLFTISEIMT